MDDQRQTSRLFRRRLRLELQSWTSAGIVTPEQATHLRRRYGLDDLSAEATTTFLHAIFVIGAVLIGCGVIAFVAAHWEAIPDLVRVGLLLAAMLTCHGVGYVFWRVRRTRPGLGHALVLLGTVIFGANIGLMAQIFHVRSESLTLFGLWSIGAVVVAYGLRSVPNLLLAIFTAFVWWSRGWIEAHPDAAWFFPVAAAIVFLPLAWRERSTAGHVVTIVAIGVSCIVLAGVEADAGGAVAAMGAAVGVAMWTYGDVHRMTRLRVETVPICSVIGVGALSVIAFIMSYHENAREVAAESIDGVHAAAGYFLALLAASALFGVYRFVRRPPTQYVAMVKMAVYLSTALVLVAVLTPVGAVVGTVLANVALLVLAAVLFAGGLIELNRALFWVGIALLVADITARFFEYETGLLTKSVVFIGIGVAVVLGGVVFEKHLEARRV